MKNQVNAAKPSAVPTVETGNVTVKADFTPGPWKMSEREPGDKEIFVEAAGDGWHLLRATVDCDDCDTETAIANARLIAAAPALYEALRESAAAIESLIAERPMLAAKRAGSTTLGNQLAEARAALALVDSKNGVNQ